MEMEEATNTWLTEPELMAPAPISGFGMSGSIAERRAAKCGFNAGQITETRFRMSAGLGGYGVQPCLTIPAGISPTALLDSPVMLPNSQAQLSPTTGAFSFPSFLDENSILSSVSVDDQVSYHQGSSKFSIRPPPGPAAYLTNFPGFGDNQETAADDRDYTLMQFEIQPDLPEEVKKSPVNSPASEGVFGTVDLKPVHIASEVPSGIDAGGSVPMKKEYAQADAGAAQDGDIKAPYNPLGMVKTSEDGYNWRKYGQKQVKGSEYPRSYYKCTHPNCQVKKKVERSHDGHITEIIYKGAHNHPKPQPPRRGAIGSTYALSENVTEAGVGNGMVASFNTEGGPIWRNVQVGPKEVKPDGHDGLSPTSVLTEISDSLSSPPRKGAGMYEPEHSPELMSTLASIDEDEVGSAAEEVDDDEPDSKRRKPENCSVESSTASRAVREPRVVIQIESEIDILEDGYRWRKYGQKVVKGNPNPRSYYKCTSTSCLVRKHVERASQDLKYVITTYEGKHNHDIPAARNSGGSGNGNGGGSAAIAPPPLAQSSALALPRNPNVMSKPESQIQDLMQYDRKPEFGLEYLRTTSLLTNFGRDMKFGQSTMYPMKFPPLRSCGSFGLAPGPIHQPRSMASVYPDLPGPMPFKFSQPASIPMTTLDYSNGKAPGMTRPFHPGEQIKEKDARFITPKQEQKDDHFYDSSFAIMDPASASPAAMFPQGLVSFP